MQEMNTPQKRAVWWRNVWLVIVVLCLILTVVVVRYSSIAAIVIWLGAIVSQSWFVRCPYCGWCLLIPWRYTFANPTRMLVVSGSIPSHCPRCGADLTTPFDLSRAAKR